MRHLHILGPVLMLAACSGETKTEQAASTGVEETSSPALPVEAESTSAEAGAPEAAIGLRPISDQDSLVDLKGELGCSFTAEGSGQPLLIALGVVSVDAGIDGIVNNAGEIVRVAAPGDYATLSRGPTLTGAGMTFTIVRGDPVPNPSEEVVHEAKLGVSRPGGASESYEGLWQCGP